MFWLGNFLWVWQKIIPGENIDLRNPSVHNCAAMFTQQSLNFSIKFQKPNVLFIYHYMAEAGDRRCRQALTVVWWVVACELSCQLCQRCAMGIKEASTLKWKRRSQRGYRPENGPKRKPIYLQYIISPGKGHRRREK